MTISNTCSRSGVVTVPVIDLSNDRPEADIVKELMTAFTTIGFATLVHHGVSSDLQKQAFQASKSFFGLSLDTKLQYKYRDQISNRGYIPCGAECHNDHLEHDLNKKSPDYKETMDIGWEYEEEYTNLWPSELETFQFKDVLLQYFEKMDALQLRLMEYVEKGLKVDPPGYLVKRCNGHHENLRLLHYPSTKKTAVRGNPHTDFGTLTLLVQDSVGGLKVQRTDGTWIDVEPTEDSIIVNVGEMLMRWSNDRLKATLHKVEAPTTADEDDESMIPERYSIAFFCNANKNVELQCLESCCSDDESPKYPPINAHQYITHRLLDTINT